MGSELWGRWRQPVRAEVGVTRKAQGKAQDPETRFGPVGREADVGGWGYAAERRVNGRPGLPR